MKDCVSAVANVDDYGGSARLLAATTLRNVLGTKTLGDILSDRESIARSEMGMTYQVYKNVHSERCRQFLMRGQSPGVF